MGTSKRFLKDLSPRKTINQRRLVIKSSEMPEYFVKLQHLKHLDFGIERNNSEENHVRGI